MHPALREARLHPRERDALRSVLRLAPWSWPCEEPFAGRARDVAALSDPPRLVPGDVALLSATEATSAGSPGRAGAAGLWLLRLRPTLELGRVAVNEPDAWRVAREVLGSTLPITWRPTSPVIRRATPPAAHLVDQLEDHWPSVLHGASFGLSFVLAMASDQLDTPVPADLVASAALRPGGELGRVAGLWDKLRLVVARAPSVRRVVVAAEQGDEARASLASLAASDVAVIPCATASEAVALALPGLELAWSERGRDPAARASGRRSLFELALSERHEALAWRPVARAAELALAAWPDLDATERAQLALARAVAHRHDGGAVPLDPPPPGLFAELPQPRRLECVSHLVQQAADTGSPDPEAMLNTAQSFLVRDADAFPAHLKLLGAIARLLATLGRPREALAHAEEAVQGWVQRRLRGASYPLCEVYRLAGALDDPAAFARASELHAACASTLDPHDELYLQVARGCALAWLGDDAAARPLLAPAWARADDPFLRMRAGRHLRLIAARAGDPATMHAVEKAAASSDPAAARTQALIALDAAQERGDTEAAAQAVDALSRSDPALMGVVQRVAARSDDARRLGWLTYVRRFYPY